MLARGSVLSRLALKDAVQVQNSELMRRRGQQFTSDWLRCLYIII